MAPATLITSELLRGWPLPRPGEEGDKEERGRVLVVGGGAEVPGGAILAGVAALRAGAGKLRIATAAGVGPWGAGGMAALLRVDREEVRREPLATARRAAAEFGAAIALKGAVTYVAAPEGEAYCNRAGNVGLATSGSGDTLAGLIAGLAARGAPP